METAFEKTLDPTAGSPATGKPVAGIIFLLMDHLGGHEMEQNVLTRLGQNYPVCLKREKAIAGHKIPKVCRTSKNVKKFH